MQRYSARLIRRYALPKPPQQKQAPTVSNSRWIITAVYRVIVGAESKTQARRQLRREYPPPRFAIGRISLIETP